MRRSCWCPLRSLQAPIETHLTNHYSSASTIRARISNDRRRPVGGDSGMLTGVTDDFQWMRTRGWQTAEGCVGNVAFVKRLTQRSPGTVQPCQGQVRLKLLTDQCTWPGCCWVVYLGSATPIWLMVSRSTWSSCICWTARSNFCWSDGSVTPIWHTKDELHHFKNIF